MNEVHEPVPAQRDQPIGLETEPTESAAEQSLDLLRRERANFLNYKRRVERDRWVWDELEPRAIIRQASAQLMPRHYDPAGSFLPLTTF
jgi:hypothetical protein